MVPSKREPLPDTGHDFGAIYRHVSSLAESFQQFKNGSRIVATPVNEKYIVEHGALKSFRILLYHLLLFLGVA